MESKIITYEDFKNEWLKEINSLSNDCEPSTVKKGKRFLEKITKQWLDLSDIDEDNIDFCDGMGDGGIDLIYLKKGDEECGEGNKLYLIQSKYNSSFKGSSTLLTETQKVIETVCGERKRLSSSLSENIVKKITNFRESTSEKDKIILVFATTDPIPENEKNVLLSIKAMGREHLGNIFDVEMISIKTIYDRIPEDGSNGRKDVFEINAHLISVGENSLIGYMTLIDLYNFIESYKEKKDDIDLLYDKNVRKYLSIKNKINKKIAETIINEPNMFGLYNNGITIVVEDFKKNVQNNKYDLIEPYVVNGCQTTKTLWEVLDRELALKGTGRNLKKEDWENKLKDGIVITKIVKVDNNNIGQRILKDITRYTNSQSIVGKKDFLSLELDFKNFAIYMAKEYDLFLEIQRASWDSQKAFQSKHPETKQFVKFANAFELLKIYGAGWLGLPGSSYRENSPFAPGGNKFDIILNDPKSNFNGDDLYASYILAIIAKEHKFGRFSERPSRRRSRYLFFMVFIELLKSAMRHASVKDSEDFKNITTLVIELSKNKEALNSLVNEATSLIDEYMSEESEESIYRESIFENKRNYDLNFCLKCGELTKDTEILKGLLKSSKKDMRKGKGNEESIDSMIEKVIKTTNIVMKDDTLRNNKTYVNEQKENMTSIYNSTDKIDSKLVNDAIKNLNRN